MTADPTDAAAPTPAEFWENRYRERPQMWSGKVNATLAEVVGGVAPGSAVDLGCGEGADALWLAEHGWQVTAVDISPTALERGAAAATAARLDGRITWRHQDLSVEDLDGGPYDLVAATFLHSPVELARERILRAAATTVAPGGHLVVIGHAEPPPWAPPAFRRRRLPSAGETLEHLELDRTAWDVLVCEHRTRSVTDPAGEPAELIDAVLHLRRRR